MNRSRLFDRRLVVIAVAVAVLLVAVGASLLVAHRKSPTGTLDVVLNLPDTSGAKVTLDTTDLKISGLRPAYTVAAGTHHISVTKPGYRDFGADFSVTRGSAVTVNVTMPRTVAVPTGSLDGRVASGINLPGLTISDSHYFYGNSWAVVKVQTTDGNIGFVIARYDDASAAWQSVRGPGTRFQSSDLSDVPTEVVQYLRGANLISGDELNE
jgi:hypothetical protein